MPAGTIALANNSATVTGTGTSFTTELKVGDFIGVIVGSAPYTAVVGSIASNTQLTLSVPFNGPSAAGLAWNPVPASLKIAITQQILNDMGTVARGMIIEKANWQKIFSSDPSVTVTMPDRTIFTGPSWGYMAAQFGNKANKGANNDITSLSALTTALSLDQGGTGAKTAALARTNLQLKTGAVFDVIGSASGGAAIIESGSSSNGNYIKFADGTLICWFNRGSIDVPSSARTEGSSSFYWFAYNWVFPASFNDSTKVSISVTTAAWGSSGGVGASAVMTGSSMSGLTNTQVSARIYAPIQFASLNPLTFIATGTWK